MAKNRIPEDQMALPPEGENEEEEKAQHSQIREEFIKRMKELHGKVPDIIETYDPDSSINNPVDSMDGAVTGPSGINAQPGCNSMIKLFMTTKFGGGKAGGFRLTFINPSHLATNEKGDLKSLAEAKEETRAQWTAFAHYCAGALILLLCDSQVLRAFIRRTIDREDVKANSAVDAEWMHMEDGLKWAKENL